MECFSLYTYIHITFGSMQKCFWYVFLVHLPSPRCRFTTYSTKLAFVLTLTPIFFTVSLRYLSGWLAPTLIVCSLWSRLSVLRLSITRLPSTHRLRVCLRELRTLLRAHLALLACGGYAGVTSSMLNVFYTSMLRPQYSLVQCSDALDSVAFCLRWPLC